MWCSTQEIVWVEHCTTRRCKRRRRSEGEVGDDLGAGEGGGEVAGEDELGAAYAGADQHQVGLEGASEFIGPLHRDEALAVAVLQALGDRHWAFYRAAFG